MGASSDLGQPFRPRQKSWVWFGRRIGYLATTFALKEQEGRKEMFYLTTHSTHFIYGYMASDIWLRAILMREETRCRHIGYSFRLAARVLLYAPSHRQDSTYHGLCYTSRGEGALPPSTTVIKYPMLYHWHYINCNIVYVCDWRRLYFSPPPPPDLNHNYYKTPVSLDWTSKAVDKEFPSSNRTSSVI